MYWREGIEEYCNFDPREREKFIPEMIIFSQTKACPRWHDETIPTSAHWAKFIFSFVQCTVLYNEKPSIIAEMIALENHWCKIEIISEKMEAEPYFTYKPDHPD